MISNNWIKSWVRKKIRYYEMYLKHNPDSPIRNEVEENIRILKDLI